MTWLWFTCLSSFNRLDCECSLGNGRGAKQKAETHKSSSALSSELADNHFYHILWAQSKSWVQTEFKRWRNTFYLFGDKISKITGKRIGIQVG
jgi:hypothetical protein